MWFFPTRYIFFLLNNNFWAGIIKLEILVFQSLTCRNCVDKKWCCKIWVSEVLLLFAKE